MRFSERCKCTDTEENPEIEDLASEKLRKSSLANLKRLWTREPSRGGSGVDVQIPKKDAKPPRKFIHLVHEKTMTDHTPTPTFLKKKHFENCMSSEIELGVRNKFQIAGS